MKKLSRLFVLVLGITPVLFFYNNCTNFKAEGSGAYGSMDQNSEGTGNTNLPMPTPTFPPPSPSNPAPAFPQGKLSVPLQVKETAGTGSTEYPITAVVPLPIGAYQNTNTFRVVDGSGATVPAQFEVLNRWWGKDNSLRNVQIHFQPTVSAYTSTGTGIAEYFFKDDGQNIGPAYPVSVIESPSEISISTGTLNVKIQKSPFKILTPAGELKAIFTGKNSNDVQESFARSDIQSEVEERGPMRAVLKFSSPTTFVDANNHRHGWALRLYAYAGKSYLKADYQLQNSDKKVKFSAALYFESLNLEIVTGKPATPVAIQADMVTSDFSTKPLGAVKAPGVNAIVRNFYETWPNGLNVDSSGKLKIELWPTWSAQYWEGAMNSTGLFWLEDMQHSYKEVLLDFANRTQEELTVLAKTFQYHPVATLPTKWYADTKATLDMGGALPIQEKLVSTDIRRPVYTANDYKAETDKKDVWRYYGFGWTNFGLDVARKLATSMTGGVPYYDTLLLVTENPADYFKAENFAAGEINIRPQWMAGYRYAVDNALLKLTENPYAGGIWRAFDGHGRPTMAVPYLAGTGRSANARDDEHGWFYNVEYGYVVTGNLWVKDWYRFVAEFRKVRLNQKDPAPDMSSRAIGHAVSHAMQAYRVTGDPELLTLTKNYLHAYVVPRLEATTGVNYSTGSTPETRQEAPFQAAYMLRSLASYNEELSADDPVVMKIFKDNINWNLTVANYGYYTGIYTTSTPGMSSGGSDVFADMTAWYMLKTGDFSALNHMKLFYQSGIPAAVGSRPYYPNAVWEGTFLNRYTPLVLK